MAAVEPITILMPCRAQPRAFFDAAVGSIVAQTSSAWRLLIIVDEDSPQEIRQWADAFADSRITILVSTGGLARALNSGMAHAKTTWLAILLADDQWTPDAVAVLQRHIVSEGERVDFFHSANCEIDRDGRRRGTVQAPRPVTADAFKTNGSPAKHLLCWRRERGLAIGGMNEQLHIGPDDYDFPWRMLEAGCRFQAIPDCLYEYRVHHDAPRITTNHPFAGQLRSLELMFANHGVSEPETAAFLESAAGGFLVKEKYFEFEPDWRDRVDIVRYREAGPERMQDFVRAGYLQRNFFPHRVYQLAKGGCDGMKLAQRMSRIQDPARLAQVVVFGLSPALDRLPPEIFFDDDLQWHQQQFGRFGQVASANLAFDGDRVFGSGYVSDLVQRISRRRELKTRVEAVFKGWHYLLLNAIMNVALDRGCRTVCSPTSALALTHTDKARNPQAALFERIYDGVIRKRYRADARDGWWWIDVAANRDRIVRLDKDVEVTPRGKTIAVCHDIERGYGHRGIDDRLSAHADAHADEALTTMLAIEREANVQATYSVVGVMLSEVRGRIEDGGHAVAFHSFDHVVPEEPAETWVTRALNRLRGRRPRAEPDQLHRCRTLDYRLKGYRPPQSRLTSELTAATLTFHNFEWIASSRSSLKIDVPRMDRGLVWIPIRFDDYQMFTQGVPFAAWKEQTLAAIDQYPFVAFSLHDCYADTWLPYYRELLDELQERGRLVTLDEVAAEVTLAHASWT